MRSEMIKIDCCVTHNPTKAESCFCRTYCRPHRRACYRPCLHTGSLRSSSSCCVATGCCACSSHSLSSRWFGRRCALSSRSSLQSFVTLIVAACSPASPLVIALVVLVRRSSRCAHLMSLLSRSLITLGVAACSSHTLLSDAAAPLVVAPVALVVALLSPSFVAKVVPLVVVALVDVGCCAAAGCRTLSLPSLLPLSSSSSSPSSSLLLVCCVGGCRRLRCRLSLCLFVLLPSDAALPLVVVRPRLLRTNDNFESLAKAQAKARELLDARRR